MSRERLKTLILSILVGMSILLTQQLWFPSPLNLLKSEARSSQVNNLTIAETRKGVISPSTVMVSFGSGGMKTNHYTILFSNLDLIWRDSKNILRDYFLGDPEITEVPYEKYAQNSILKSIELEFSKNMPSTLISSVFDSSDSKIAKNIKRINKILIPAFNRGIIYIIEGSNTIFEVKLPKYEENSTLLNFIDELEKVEHIKYHPIFAHIDNYTPMPVNYAVPTVQTFVESEIDINNESVLIERSKGFFNENFDFVKTIKETSGAVVYIYGYGEKSVRINNKGGLEYNEALGNISSSNILGALDMAIDFISKNGGFPEGAYLKDIRDISEGENKGYKFSFGYRIGGLPVEFNGNEMKSPMEIEVYGNKVKSYSRLVRKVMDIQGIIPEQSVLHFPDIITKNIKHLKLKDLESGNQSLEEIDDEEKILEILRNLEEVKMVYFDTVEEGKGQLLRPSWRIKIKGDLYYFDSYTGDLINSVTLN